MCQVVHYYMYKISCMLLLLFTYNSLIIYSLFNRIDLNIALRYDIIFSYKW